MEKLATVEQFEDWINSGKTAIAVFKTTWCADCHYLDVFMPSIEKEYADKVEFLEVDRDEFPDLGEKYSVLGIPSFIAFKNGKEITRFVSKMRKEKSEIEHYLDRTVSVAEALAK